MGKILVFVSIVLTLTSAGLGFVNRGKFVETKDTLASTQSDLSTTKGTLSKTQGELKTTKDDLATSTAKATDLEGQVAKLNTDLSTEKSNSAKLTADLTTAKGNVDQLTTDLAAKTKELEDIKTASGTGGPAASGPDPAQTARIQELETVVASMTTELTSAKEKVVALEKEKQDRALKLTKKGLEGRILAVNPAWNFVVLNIGDKNGVASNSEMLVKRGNQLVGKVRITSVEPSTSIADIVASSVPQGTSISPGDNVIAQTVED